MMFVYPEGIIASLCEGMGKGVVCTEGGESRQIPCADVVCEGRCGRISLVG